MTISVNISGCRTAPSPTPSLLASFLQAVRVWKERRELANMDASRLRDIGISQNAATREATRPIWDLPSRRC